MSDLAMTEERLLDALRAAMVPARPTDDPGLTIVELAHAEYGNEHCNSRIKVSKRLKPLLAAGTIRRGWRHDTRIDGQPYRVAVFAVVDNG
jgi:hypothetical protein